MDQLAGVQVVQPEQHLHGDVLALDQLQPARLDGPGQIYFHQLENCIHVLGASLQALLVLLADDDLLQLDDTGVCHLQQVGQLAISALGIGQILEGVDYFFNGIGSLGGFVDDAVDLAVNSLAYFGFNSVGLVYTIIQS